jgi:hypothetical protein
MSSINSIAGKERAAPYAFGMVWIDQIVAVDTNLPGNRTAAFQEDEAGVILALRLELVTSGSERKRKCNICS